MIQHPHQVFIPDSKTEGVRAYREPEVPHPLQLAFLEEAGERAYVEHLRALLSAGKLDEADAILTGDLAGFQGRVAKLCHAATRAEVTIEGWDDLLPILEEHEGPPITAITVGLTNEPDLVFDNGAEHEPALVVALYSDDSYGFSSAPVAAVLAECLSETPAFAGHDEDVEFYAVSQGLAPLNTALIQSKHRYFLRDGRDGVEGRAPGGYVEYVLATWLRALRFLQALRDAARMHGLPAGARLIAGTVGLQTDLACMLDEGTQAASTTERPADNPAPVATLTMKKWTPRPDPLADPPVGTPETGSSIRRRVAEPIAANSTGDENTDEQFADSPEMVEQAEIVSDVPQAVVQPTAEPRLGFLARIFRIRGGKR